MASPLRSTLSASSQSLPSLRFPLLLPFSPSPFGFFDPFRSRFGTWFCCSSVHRFTTSPHSGSVMRLPFLSDSGLPLSFLLPFVSSGSAFRPLCFRSASSALGSGYWAYRYTLKTEHRLFILQLYLKTSLSLRFGQAFGLLVSVSYTHYCASTSDLSTT